MGEFLPRPSATCAWCWPFYILLSVFPPLTLIPQPPAPASLPAHAYARPLYLPARALANIFQYPVFLSVACCCVQCRAPTEFPLRQPTPRLALGAPTFLVFAAAVVAVVAALMFLALLPHCAPYVRPVPELITVL